MITMPIWNTHMYQLYYDILQLSLHQGLQLHYMDSNCVILSFTRSSLSDEGMDLSKLDNPITTNEKVPGKFKHELGRRVAIKPKTYSFITKIRAPILKREEERKITKTNL